MATETELMLADVARHTPEEGFSLVGLDDYELPGEQLYTIAHFDTREEAEAAKANRSKDETTYIYPAKD